MKVKTRQHTLGKLQKMENLKTVTKITTYPEPDDKTMIGYLCKKHKFMFWHNIKTGTGMCLFCRQESINTLKDHHVKDTELTREILRIVFDELEGSDEMKVEESIKINDGKYQGSIVDMTEKTEPYEYIHFVVEYQIDDNTKKKFDYSCPSNITIDKETGTPTSKLAETLTAFGFKMEKGKDISLSDLKNHFVGKKVESLLRNATSKKGAKIVEVVTMTSI